MTSGESTNQVDCHNLGLDLARATAMADELQDILHQILGIRTCGDPEPIQRCLEHEIGRCAGPCRGALGPGEYQDLVALARSFEEQIEGWRAASRSAQGPEGCKHSQIGRSR